MIMGRELSYGRDVGGRYPDTMATYIEYSIIRKAVTDDLKKMFLGNNMTYDI